MEINRKDSQKILEAAIDAVRTTDPDRMEMEERAARVWARIGTEFGEAGQALKSGQLISATESRSDQIRNCDDYRALIPDYLAGSLSPARALLFKDHTNECVACRNALNAARGAVPFQVVRPAQRRFNPTFAVSAIAAALVLGIGLWQTGYLNFLLPVVEVKATARAIDGKLYRVAGLNMNAVVAGTALTSGETFRTAGNSNAVIELADGTHIEMRERSQLSLAGTHDGIRVNLDRGTVIVQAAKQRNGHLYVATEDCTVSVVGTVFAVSAGVRGSRVSVIEGKVHVARLTSAETTLLPGQQLTTAPSLTSVPIEEEISWSRNLDTHLTLLRAAADATSFLSGRIPGPQLRSTSTLLPLVPPNTVVYVAIPNITSELAQAFDLFRQRIDQNPLLREWWAQRNRKDSNSPTLEDLIAHVRNLGDQLGDEIVIAATGSSAGPADLIVLATVRNPEGVLTEMNALAASTSSQHPLRVLTDYDQLASLSGNLSGPAAYVDASILMFGTSTRTIYGIATAQRSGGSGFSLQPFHASIAQAYAKGVGTLFAADLATLFSDAQRSEQGRALGLSSIDHLVFEQKQLGGKTVTQAQLNFKDARTGAAAWLTAPAPMGALEFVSPQAYGVVSLVTKDALTILDEMLNLIGAGNGEAALEEFRRETGVDLRRDLVEPLGGEFLVAMDGPFLPTPSWKLVAEVYESARLQNAIERLVYQLNSRYTLDGKPAISLTSEAVGSQVYYLLRRANNTGPEIHYTYAMGYIVAAPSRALVSQALQYEQNRSSIADSSKFRSMIPADSNDHCSAILYQNLTETANSIANYVPAGVGGITQDQLQSLRQTIELNPPSLVCASGEPNRIVMGYQGDLALNVLLLGGMRNMLETLETRR